MSVIKFASEDYPLNLLEDIVGSEWGYDCPYDFEQSLEYVLAGLRANEYKVIRMYYREGKSQKDIGRELELSASRIGQIRYKALRKLRHISRLNYLIYGVKGMEQRAVQKALNVEYTAAAANIAVIARNLSALTKSTLKKSNLGDFKEICNEINMTAPIETLDFSVRTYNCLLRAGILTIGDLLGRKPDELYYIRNLGKKSFEEICEKLSALGLEYKLDKYPPDYPAIFE